MIAVASPHRSLLLVLLLAPSLAQAVERRTAVVDAVERASPAVVSVRTKSLVTRSREPFSWFFRDFSAPRRRADPASQGSGVIIDEHGHVLTNYHVIAVGGDIEIELTSGETLVAGVVGTAPEHDLAVLRARTRSTLPIVPMGTSSDLMIGETVIAIGNPFGLSHTVTTGVVSALHRFISVRSGTPAGRVGLRPGDWIRAVNSEKVLGIEEFGKAIARCYWRGQVHLLVQRGRAWQEIGFEF